MSETEFSRRGDAIAVHESKWNYHPEAVRHMLRFRCVELFYDDEYSASFEKGGTGSKKKVKWRDARGRYLSLNEYDNRRKRRLSTC